MNYRYLAIEGNIGAGKTTLAILLAAHYNAHLVLEEFADNPFLPKFYAEPDRFALPLELSFLADRYQQLKKQFATADAFGPTVVADYAIAKSRLFAHTNLKEEEYALFQQFFDLMDQQLPRPDLLIYLYAPIQKLQRNIADRGREYEQTIPDDYLNKVEHSYQQYLNEGVQKTLIIEMDQANFLNTPEHFEQLLEFLEKETDFMTHLFVID